MKIELVAYSQANPALDPADLLEMSDLATIWNGASTYPENVIEYAGRVCYRSTHRMGTAPRFIVNRVKEGHEDIIEHIVATVRVRNSEEPLRWRLLNRHCEVTQEADGSWLVSANTRVWLDFFRRGIGLQAMPFLQAIAPKVYAEFAADIPSGNGAQAPEPAAIQLPPSMPSLDVDTSCLRPREEGPLRVTLLAFTQPGLDHADAQLHHGSATFFFEGISRACTHQLVRHRLASFSQESQRYVQYESMEPSLAPRVPRLPDPQHPKRHGLCHFSLDQEEFITNLYREGFSGETLAKAYDAHPTTIRNIVKGSGAEFRDRRASRTMHIKTDFFDEIDTPVKAQMLGLIFADGNVAQRDGKISYASIAQHSDYRSWLKRLGKLWGGNVISGGRDGSSKLMIPGTKLAEALVRHGVVPAKSRILKPPTLEGELARHFIRGYVEGDGHISNGPDGRGITISGTQAVLRWIQSEICAAIDREPKQKIRHNVNDSYAVSFGGKYQVPEILEWLYNGFDLRYSHPAKLRNATEWSLTIRNEFQRQLADWAKSLNVIHPPKFDPTAASIWMDAMEVMAQSYADLRHLGIRKEDARFLLPNAAETRIVTSMNFAAWSHFLWLRAVDKAAQWEIRRLGQLVLEMLYTVAPGVFQEHWDVYREKFPASS
ncbi:MAG: FAD-dependent thymidylate synthase [Caldilineaceae bacterium]|nr:FAD-dependent thymidylate synthase [Caldilineaceae bacterium]